MFMPVSAHAQNNNNGNGNNNNHNNHNDRNEYYQYVFPVGRHYSYVVPLGRPENNYSQPGPRNQGHDKVHQGGGRGGR